VFAVLVVAGYVRRYWRGLFDELEAAAPRKRR
jgi:hypothetical protein